MSADDIARNIAKIADRLRDQLADGIEDLVEHIGEESQRICPIEEGTLVKSMTTKVDRAALEAGIGYGSGAAAPYAIRQHEDTSLSHDAGRSAKYLEIPLVTIGTREGLDIIARHVK